MVTLPQVVSLGIYLVVMGVFIALMIPAYRKMPDEKKAYVRWILFANILLALGDCLHFAASFVGYATGNDLSIIDLVGLELQLGTIGMIATSITMSLYYLFFVFYSAEKYQNGTYSYVDYALIALFIVRVVLIFNPANIWFTSQIPPGELNYTSWIRNIPFFLYGIPAVILLWRNASTAQEDSPTEKKIVWLCYVLMVSWISYGLAVYLAFDIMTKAILYIAKTLAYLVAAFLVYRSEFQVASDANK